MVTLVRAWNCKFQITYFWPIHCLCYSATTLICSQTHIARMETCGRWTISFSTPSSSALYSSRAVHQGTQYCWKPVCSVLEVHVSLYTCSRVCVGGWVCVWVGVRARRVYVFVCECMYMGMVMIYSYSYWYFLMLAIAPLFYDMCRFLPFLP